MRWGLVAGTVGGIFQVSGVILVFIQIGEAERLLKVASWPSELREWLKRPVINALAALHSRQKVKDLSLSTIGAATSSGSAELTLSRSRGTTVGERLASLQIQMDDVRHELDEFRKRVGTDRAFFERKLAEVEASLGALDADLRRLIAALTVGSRRLQVIGAVLIVCGTILVTVSPFLP